MAQVLARDLCVEHRCDSFMGEGFENLLAQAEAEGKELVVGEFLLNKDWFIE